MAIPGCLDTAWFPPISLVMGTLMPRPRELPGPSVSLIEEPYGRSGASSDRHGGASSAGTTTSTSSVSPLSSGVVGLCLCWWVPSPSARQKRVDDGEVEVAAGGAVP